MLGVFFSVVLILTGVIVMLFCAGQAKYSVCISIYMWLGVLQKLKAQHCMCGGSQPAPSLKGLTCNYLASTLSALT